MKALQLTETEIILHRNSNKEMENSLQTDRKAAIADMRYLFIDRLCSETVVKPLESKQHIRTEKIDRILTNKYLAIPIFLIMMGIIFWLTFGVIGGFLSDLLGNAITGFSDIVKSGLKLFA